MKKKVLSLLSIALISANSFAQGIQGASGAIDNASGELNTLYGSVATLIFALAAIIALVGAIKIFMAWNSGERDVQKMVIGWFGACIFLVAIGAVIEGFFAVG